MIVRLRGAAMAALLTVAIAVAFYWIAPGFFWKDDFQLQYLPGSYEVAQAWRTGTFPLLSQSSWFCSALGAEYQYGVFSLFRTLLDIIVWWLPLSLGGRAATLFIVHAAVAAAGAYLLARSYGVRQAMMVAVIASLNGWLLWWGTTWFTGMASFAWLPWYWLALKGIADGRKWSWLGAALSLYLVVSAGWPYTVAMAALVTGMYLLSLLVARRFRTALVIAGSAALGLGLAAPAVMMLLEYFQVTARMPAAARLDDRWVVPQSSLFGLVLPTFSAVWRRFADTEPHASVELAGGLIPLAGIAAMLATARLRFYRRYWPELVLLLTTFFLLLLPGVGTFRWPFRWLPLFHLALAILGACALRMLDDETDGRLLRRPSSWAGILIVVALLAALAFDHNLRDTAMLAVLLLALCGAWLQAERTGSRMAAVAPTAITVVLLATVFLTTSADEVGRWSFDESLRATGPYDPGRRYLSLHDANDMWGKGAEAGIGINPQLRNGNTPMLSGLRFINGYSPLGPAALANVFRFGAHGVMDRGRIDRVLRLETAPNALLSHMGVDGLIVSKRDLRVYSSALADHGWRPVSEIGRFVIYHRNTPLPEPVVAVSGALQVPTYGDVLSVILGRETPRLPVLILGPEIGRKRYGFRALTDVRESRLRVEVNVRGSGEPALILFRRAWVPGWRATLDGKPLRVLRADLLMPAVELPAGAAGRLVLVYRPVSLMAGAVVAAVSLAVILAVSLWLRLKT